MNGYEQCRERDSIVLICGPSTLNPADLQMLAARADGIVFTVTPQSLRPVYGDEVIHDLMELGAPVPGFADSEPYRASDFSSQFDSDAAINAN